MTLRSLALAALLALPHAAAAQDADEVARQYVEGEAVQAMLDDMLSADAMMQMFEMQGVALPENRRDEVAGIVAEELATVRPDMEAAMIAEAAETFTLEELVALEAFYSSPVGASILAKNQAFMAETMGRIAPQMADAQGRIGERVVDALSR